MSKFIAILKAPDLRIGLWYLLGGIFIYRLCLSIPIPGIDIDALHVVLQAHPYLDQEGSYAGFLNIISVFFGGGIGNASLLSLGITPFCLSSVITSLFVAAHPQYSIEHKKQNDVVKSYQQLLDTFFSFALSIFFSFCLIRFFSNPIIVENQTVVLLKGGFFTAFMSVFVGCYLMKFIISQMQLLSLAGTSSAELLVAINQLAFVLYIIKNIDSYSFGLIIMLFSIAIICCFIAILGDKTYVKVSLNEVLYRNGNPVAEEGKKHIKIRPSIWKTIDVYIGLMALGVLLSTNFLGVMYVLLVLCIGILLSVFLKSESMRIMMISSCSSVFLMAFICYLTGIKKIISLDFSHIVVSLFLLRWIAGMTMLLSVRTFSLAESIMGQGLFIPGVRPGDDTANHLQKYVNNQCTFILVIGLIILYMPPAIINIFGYQKMLDSLGIQVFGLTMCTFFLKILPIISNIDRLLVMRHYDGFLKKRQ